MYTPIRFGLRGLENGHYAFPADSITSFDKNFSNVVLAGDRVPGQDGSFDMYGRGIAPTEKGSVSLSHVVSLDGAQDAQGVIDKITGKLVAMGKQPLFFMLDGTGYADRFCWARLNNSSVPVRARNMPSQRLRLTYDMRVDYPVMMGLPDVFYWTNDDLDTSSGITSTASRVEEEVVSDGTLVSVTNNGEYPALCYVRFDFTDTTVNPGVRRYDVDGVVHESLMFSGTYEANDVVIANGTTKATVPESLYPSVVKQNNRWLTIPPGTSEVEVFGAFDTTAKLTLNYFDCWK